VGTARIIVALQLHEFLSVMNNCHWTWKWDNLKHNKNLKEVQLGGWRKSCVIFILYDSLFINKQQIENIIAIQMTRKYLKVLFWTN